MDNSNNNGTVNFVFVEPAGPNGQQAQQAFQKAMEDTARAVNDSINSFSDEIPPSDEEVKKATGFLHGFMEYIKGDKFKSDVNGYARKYGVPPKRVAESFFGKALGAIGDVLGIAIGTVGNAGHLVVELLSTVAHGAVNLMCNVANALARIFTLNKSCIAF